MTEQNWGSVVFFGSGPVARRSLELLQVDFSIEAIVTKPATLREMQDVARNTLVYGVSTKTDLDEIFTTHTFQSKLAILIDFGIIVSPDVINTFPLGIINSHFSLLPEWRGADPITFTILSGQEQTGVSLMLLTEGLDEGPLLAQSICTVGKNTTTPQLTEELIELSAAMLQTVVPAYVAGEVVAVPQLEGSLSSSELPSYSRKLTKNDGILDWTKPAVELEREVRAFVTWPKSRTILGSKEVIITAAQVTDIDDVPGHIRMENKHLLVGCSKGSLKIERLKPAGKPEMSTSAFLAGYRRYL